ncbi:hypothetical protein SERLADRAFT_400225 [Serpula lacrymans var. lacrymans S7.9]|uniref:Uncharacterized protein n=1 Tax=Serpula lacrymans var. lacrymans (strain S7.9) TaxID=578457 RepID=F8P921_SERL9|nr:uncharacterized protein SERLADRAFT_400225 [Serpula lacrymans var. lacrymans S7.9]EGO20150.1 hypothetical protein SERLADRAFT_400225 [Serpula lacrymans var. lacrymans S7.9]
MCLHVILAQQLLYSIQTKRPITTESDERDLRSLPPSAGEQVYTDCTTPQACDIQRSVKGF